MKNVLKEKIPSYDIHNFFKNEQDFVHFDIDNIEDTIYNKDLKISKSHKHNFFSIFIIEEGTGMHLIDFVQYQIKPKSIFSISPGSVHNWMDTAGIKGHAITFTEEFYSLYASQKSILREFAFLYGISNIPIINASNQLYKKVLRLTKDIYIEFESSESNKNDVIANYLLILLYFLKRFVTSQDANDLFQNSYPLINQFLILVEENYVKMKNVRDYAVQLNVTSNYLNYLSRKITGKSAGNIIRERLVLEAKRNLIHSDLIISEIAYKLGYEDPSYFARLFKKMTQQTPKEFRNNFL